VRERKREREKRERERERKRERKGEYASPNESVIRYLKKESVFTTTRT